MVFDETPVTSRRYVSVTPRPTPDEPPQSTDPRPLLWGEPVLHFQTGAASPFRRELLREFNDTRDYAHVAHLLSFPKEVLSAFQLAALSWVLAIVTGSSRADECRSHTKDHASTPAEWSVYEENRVFQLMLSGKLKTARYRARAALSLSPASQGLWVNLLVTMNRLDEQEAVEAALLDLPRIVPVDRGLLGVYLEREPGLRRPVCNGG
jgi:hypothetical protein